MTVAVDSAAGANSRASGAKPAIVIGLLAGALVGVIAVFNSLSLGLAKVAFSYDRANYSLDSALVAFACAALVVYGASRLSLRLRLISVAASLLAAAALLALEPSIVGDWQTSHQWPGGLLLLVVAQLAQAVGIGFGVGIVLESAKGGAGSGALISATKYLAFAVNGLSITLARNINPDFFSPTSFVTLVGAVAALAAAGALAMLLISPSSAPAPAPAAGAANLRRAATQGLQARRPGLMVGGYALQLCLIAALVGLGSEFASAKGADLAKVYGYTGLSDSAEVLGLFIGALLTSRWRRSPEGPGAVAVWAISGAALVYMFAVNITDAQQSMAFFALATGMAAAAWAPTFVAVFDNALAADRPAVVAALILLFGQLPLLGLSELFGAAALKLAGATNWTFTVGFWGNEVLGWRIPTGSTSFSNHFMLPIRLSADLGDQETATYVFRTACILLVIALAAPITLYRLAGRVDPSAKPVSPTGGQAGGMATATCAKCGAANDPADQFCGQCGARMRTGGAHSAWKPLVPILIGAAASCLVIVAGMAGDAQGLLHKQWTNAIVWKSPDATADTSIKACQAWPCLIDAMKTGHAPDEAIKFMQTVGLQAPTDTVGYPIAFDGKGRVKVVTIFEPGLGMDGMNDFVFVNGTKEIVRPTDNVDQIAETNPAYQGFKMQYPQVTPWDGPAFQKEVILPDGSQQFQFQQTLLNGCHACAVLGSLDFSYNFDRRGHYTGVTIQSVEADQKAPYAALTDRLAQESAFYQNENMTDANGIVVMASVQTGLQAKERCQLSIMTNPNMPAGWFILENAFNARNVAIRTSAAFNAAAPLQAATDAASAPPPPPTPPTNQLTIWCTNGQACISQDYSDKRGHAPPMTSVNFIVPAEKLGAVIQDFQMLQTMCGAPPPG